MKLDSVGEIIAMRILELVQTEGPPSVVTVLLGKPQRLPNFPDYYCPYQIKGAGSEKIGYTCGIDAFQALQLVLSRLSMEVEVLNKELDGRLRWDADDRGDLGFPAAL
jgi:hypothetical protein